MLSKSTFIYSWLFVILLMLLLGHFTDKPAYLDSTPIFAQSDTPTPTVLPTPIVERVPNSLALINRQLSPPQIGPGQETTVSLSIQGTQNNACRGIPGRPADVFLVFDVSDSAGDGQPGSNLERTVGLTQLLLDALGRPIYSSPTSAAENSRVGLISSQTGTLGPESVLLGQLTDDFTLLRGQVQALTPSGDTDIASGLRLAAEQLSGIPSERVPAVILMLHDNVALDESTKIAVQEVNDQGIDVYLLVNSLNIDLVSPDKLITSDLATQIVAPEQFLLDPNAEQLYDLFISITEGSKGLAAAGIQLIDTITPPDQITLSNVTGNGGAIQGNQVIWQIPAVKTNETIDLGYQLALAQTASGSFNIQNSMTWLDCNGLPSTTAPDVVGGEVLPVPTATSMIVTVEPNPVTSIPSSPVPSESTPTPDDGSGSVPDDESGSIPDNGNGGISISLPDGGSVSIPLPIVGIAASINWLWILVLLLLLILAAIALWWWFNRTKTSPRVNGVRPNGRPDPPSPISIPPTRRTTGQDIIADWKTEDATDQQGRSVTIRFSRLVNKKQTIRIDDERSELARASISLESITKLDRITEHESELHRLRIHDFEVERSGRRRGMEGLLLNKIEELASTHGASEVYSQSPSETLRRALSERKYESREEEPEMFKTLDKSSK